MQLLARTDARLALSLLLVLAPATRAQTCEPTPIDSFPQVIDEPGRYCLTRSSGFLSAAVPEAILVTARPVVIDLNGFSLLGGGGSNQAGIRATQPSTTVLNGTVRNFGIALELGEQCVVENVLASASLNGANLGGRARVRNSEFVSFSAIGLVVGQRSIVENCVVTTAAQDDPAVQVGHSSIVDGMTIQGGSIGLQLAERSQASRCIVVDPVVKGVELGHTGCLESSRVTQEPRGTAIGIDMGDHSRIAGCTVRGGNQGIRASRSGAIQDSNVTAAVVGIEAGPYTRIEGCTVSESVGDGIVSSSSGVTVNDTTTVDNGANGIRLTGIGSSAKRCTSLGNGANGLLLGHGGAALQNIASLNAGAGLYVTGVGNRIEDNSFGGNGIGLELAGAQSLAVGNHAVGSGGGDFVIPFPNPVGPILTSPFWIPGSVPQANFGTTIP